MLTTGKLGIQTPARARDFTALQNFQTGRGSHPSSFNKHRDPFPGIKLPGREANHSLPSIAESKNEWRSHSSPPMCLHGLDTENCTFSLLSNRYKY